MKIPRVILKPGREKSLRRRHPWIFSGAIQKIDGQPQNGETVQLCAADGTPLATGAYSKSSQISVRAWSFDVNESINADFFRKRLRAALALRQALSAKIQSNAYRIVNAENDGLPGLVVDGYGDFLVCQFLSAGVEHWKQEIVTQLLERLQPSGVYERSDVPVRQKEGLEPVAGVLAGEAPPEMIEIAERDLRFRVDIKNGQKTGFYLDQRANRSLVVKFTAGAEVLNTFAYTGGFGVWALKGSAKRVTNVESSPSCLQLAEQNLTLNGFDPALVENLCENAFHALRHFRDAGRQFDVVILDPPKFADSQAHLQKAARGYKDINLLACKLIRPGGWLFTFSCSGVLGADLFQKIVADAALDAGREVQIVQRLAQAVDHPVALNFPEGAYLKGLVCRVVNGQ